MVHSVLFSIFSTPINYFKQKVSIKFYSLCIIFQFVSFFDSLMVNSPIYVAKLEKITCHIYCFAFQTVNWPFEIALLAISLLPVHFFNFSSYGLVEIGENLKHLFCFILKIKHAKLYRAFCPSRKIFWCLLYFAPVAFK